MFDLSMEAYRVGRTSFQRLIINCENLLRFRIDRQETTATTNKTAEAPVQEDGPQIQWRRLIATL